MLLKNCAENSQTFPISTSLYLTPWEVLHVWFWIRKPEPKRREAGSFSKSERQRLQRLYTQRAADYGFECNLLKASNLPVSKLRQFLLSKISYAKSPFATQLFEGMKAFAGFIFDIWCMDLDFVDKLAMRKNGEKYLLDHEYFFDRKVYAIEMNTTDTKKL